MTEAETQRQRGGGCLERLVKGEARERSSLLQNKSKGSGWMLPAFKGRKSVLALFRENLDALESPVFE